MKSRMWLGLVLLLLVSVAPSFADLNTRVSLDFKNADIRDALKLIAQKAGFNIFIDKSIRGNVTFKVDDLTAEETIEHLVFTNGLHWVRVGKSLVVSPLNRLRPEQKMCRLQNIPAHRAVKSLLTAGSRTRMSAFGAGNVLLVKGTPDDVAKIGDTLNRMDVPRQSIKGTVSLLRKNKKVYALSFVGQVGEKTLVTDDLSASGPQGKKMHVGVTFFPEWVNDTGVLMGSLSLKMKRETKDQKNESRCQTLTVPLKVVSGKALRLASFEEDGEEMEIGFSAEFSPEAGSKHKR